MQLRCIWFFHKGMEMPHCHPDLERVECVSITFKMQKKDEKSDTVNQLASGDTVLCPAAIVKRVMGYLGSSDNTPVSVVWNNGCAEHITSQMLVNAVEAAVEAVGQDVVNIQVGEIGTHSIQSGAAMAMYLGDVPVYNIMMLERWSSNAFLQYIRKQVEQFSHDISKKMIAHQFHWHVPQINQTISCHDPRQRSHPSNKQTQVNVGGDASH